MSKIFSPSAVWQYQATANVAPVDPAAVVVPAAGWSAPAPAPFGTIGTAQLDVKIATAWAAGTAIWIRRNIDASGLAGLLLHGRIENACLVYWDGVYVGAINPANAGRVDIPDFQMVIPLALAPAGVHELALLCLEDAGGTSYVYVEGEYQPALIPLWPATPLQESLEWFTDVSIAENSTEDRVQKRESPRQAFDLDFYVAPSWQPRIKNLVYGHRTKPWLIPAWPFVLHIGEIAAGAMSIELDTQYTEHRAGGLALIWQDPLTWQIVGVDTVAADELVLSQMTAAFADAYVIPLRRGYMTRDPGRRFTGTRSALSLGFAIEDNAALTVGAPTQYLGNDIYFEPGLMDGRELNEQMDGRFDLFDEDIGLVAYRAPWLRNRPRRPYRAMGDGAAEAWALRLWLHRRAGRLRPFWLPSGEADLIPVSTGALTVTLDVRSDGYMQNAGGRDHIAIEKSDGTWLARAIDASAQLDPDTVRLTLSASIAMDAAQIERISWLGLQRLDADRVEINWIGGLVAVIAPPIVEIEP